MIMLGFVIWIIGICAVDAQPQCSACQPGKYKSTNMNEACTNCPPSTYFAGYGGIDVSVCTNCTSNSASMQGASSASACICNLGYTKTGSTCSACAIGKYKAGNGDESCTDCPPNSATLFVGGKSVSDCQCNAGYTGVPGSCVPSPAGTYKSLPGTGSATPCPANSTSLAGSTLVTNCTCLAGFTGVNGGSCSACEAGKFKSAGGSSLCEACISNSTSVAGSTASSACLCLPGYARGAGNACLPCGMGTYKNGINDNACVNCPNSTFSGVLGATSVLNCIGCRSNSTASEASQSANDCKCDAGYYTRDMNLPNATCLQCVPGKFSAKGVAACSSCGPGKFAAASGSTSDVACLGCPAGKFSFLNQSQCDTCPSNSWSPSSSGVIENCTCNAGYWPKNTGVNGGPCSSCDPGTYKDQPGPQACTPFSAGFYSSIVAATSIVNGSACPGNSSSPSGSNSISKCACVAGYAGNILTIGDKCAACEPGKYRTAAALPSESCTNCPAGSFSNITAKTDSNCTSCGTYSISPAGSSSSVFCVCSAGYGLNA